MARNTGKRPHELALEVLKPGVTMTPSELEAHVGNGPYASKHIWFLRKLGHDITVNKDGRTVLSYTYNGAGTAKQAAPKAAVSNAEIRRQNAASAAKSKTMPKAKKVEHSDETLRVLGSSGAVKSYSIDPDWDAVEGDVRELIG